MTFRAARAALADPRRSPRELRATLDSIADEILARLENVMAERERHGAATVIISGESGEAPVGSRRDAQGWATRIVDASQITDPRRR